MNKQNYISSHPGYEELEVPTYKLHRLFLVTPDVKYATDSLAWVSDKQAGQYMGADFSNVSLDGEKERLNKILEDRDGYNWIIECDGKAIGNINIGDIKKTSEEFGKKTGSLNYLIGTRDLWGKGIATAVTQRVLDWALEKGSFELIKARVIPQNKASEVVLIKLGFIEYGKEDYDGPDIGEPTWYIPPALLVD